MRHRNQDCSRRREFETLYDQRVNCRSGHPGASGHRTAVRPGWERPCLAAFASAGHCMVFCSWVCVVVIMAEGGVFTTLTRS